MQRFTLMSFGTGLFGSLVGLLFLLRPGGAGNPIELFTAFALLGGFLLACVSTRVADWEALAGFGLGAMLFGAAIKLHLSTGGMFASLALVGIAVWSLLNAGRLPWRKMRVGEVGSFAFATLSASAPLRLALEGATVGRVVGITLALGLAAALCEMSSIELGSAGSTRRSAI